MEIENHISDDYGLLPLWDSLYKIYEEFAKICERHGLRYYALGGTALGAVRHNGFIPWDDDFDVAMPRPDYERFKNLYSKELPGHLKFGNWTNMPGYQKLFGKILDTRKDVVVALEKKLGFVLSNGVFIDVFPLDGYPESAFRRWRIRIKHWWMAFVWHYLTRRPEDCSPKGKLARIIGMCLMAVIPQWRGIHNLLKIYENDAMSIPYDESRLVSDVSTFTDIFHRKPQSRDSWGNGKEHPFFGKKIRLPASPDDPLTSRYGKDYMVLPPLIKRHPTHTEKIHHPWWLGPTGE